MADDELEIVLEDEPAKVDPLEIGDPVTPKTADFLTGRLAYASIKPKAINRKQNAVVGDMRPGAEVLVVR